MSENPIEWPAQVCCCFVAEQEVRESGQWSFHHTQATVSFPEEVPLKCRVRWGETWDRHGLSAGNSLKRGSGRYLGKAL